MSLLGVAAEVMAIEALTSYGKNRDPSQRNSFSPLKMLGAVMLFEAVADIAGPLVGLAAAATMAGAAANMAPAAATGTTTGAATAAATAAPRVKAPSVTPSLNMAPKPPAGMGM